MDAILDFIRGFAMPLRFSPESTTVMQQQKLRLIHTDCRVTQDDSSRRLSSHQPWERHPFYKDGVQGWKAQVL